MTKIKSEFITKLCNDIIWSIKSDGLESEIINLNVSRKDRKDGLYINAVLEIPPYIKSGLA